MDKIYSVVYDDKNVNDIYSQIYMDDMNDRKVTEFLKDYELQIYNENDELSCFLRGVCYYRELFGFPISEHKARGCFEEVLKKNPNNQYAMVELAYILENGLDYDKDYNRAKELYEKAVKMMNHKAMCNLASMYNDGRGVKKDLGKAEKLYKQAVELGNRNAMNNLGHIFEFKKKYSDAEKLYQQAVELKSFSSMLNLALLYMSGNIKKNFIKAYDLLNNIINNCQNSDFVEKTKKSLSQLYKTIDTCTLFKILLEQRDKIDSLEKEIVELKKV